jgi:catechol 2,3-dioxygenase-like lactoylglutathione lyase family enzyme
MIRRIDHTTITVSDIQRSVEFYTGLLGFVIDHEMWIPESRLRIVFLRVGDTILELFGVPECRGSAVSEVNEVIGYKHICLRVDSVDEEYARLHAAGVSFYIPPSNVQNVRIAFFKDPDGLAIELIEDLDEVRP